MNEEEKKAIENLKRKLKSNKKYFEIEGFYLSFDFETEKEIKLLINLIEKQQKEIQFQKEINKTEQDRTGQTEKSLKGQLKNKDKIIDLMAEKFEDLKIAYFKKEDGGEFMGKYRTYNKNDWKQYFKEKVENGTSI